jgi:hypothetical protein
VADPDLTTIWTQEWKNAEQLGMEDDLVVMWNQFITNLSISLVRLKEDEERLIQSKNPSGGRYTPRIGYKVLCEEENEEHPEWWWKLIWKFKCSLKITYLCGRFFKIRL